MLFPLGAFVGAFKVSSVREHLVLVSRLHPFLLLLLSCCLNLCPAMPFLMFCVTVISQVCLPHYSVISFRLEMGLLCICTFSLNPDVWKMVGASQICVEWDEIWQCLRCCVSCPSDLESIFIFLVSKAQSLEQEQLVLYLSKEVLHFWVRTASVSQE